MIVWLLVFLAVAFSAATAEGQSGARPDRSSVDVVKPPEEGPALIPLFNIFHPRRAGVWVRSGPGHQYPAVYRLTGDDTGFPSVGKHDQKDRFEKATWYKLDLGQDRNGFVSGKDVMSAAGHQRKLEWEEFIFKLKDFVADARKQNIGPYAARAGVYVLNKNCTQRPASDEASALMAGLGTWFIWFENDKMYFMTMIGSIRRQEGRLLPSRVFEGKEGRIQWYKWNDDQVAFIDGSYAFEPTFEKTGLSTSRPRSARMRGRCWTTSSTVCRTASK